MILDTDKRPVLNIDDLVTRRPLYGLEPKEQADRILKAFQEVVEEVGRDHVYQRHLWSEHTGFPCPMGGATVDTFCAYVHPSVDQPDCIIGRIFHRLGVSTTELRQQEGNAPQDLAYLLGISPEMFMYDVFFALGSAQGRSDKGLRWGRILDQFVLDLNFARTKYGYPVSVTVPA
jgi:hypothetical protein